MALPWLFRKLFQNDGAGDKLNASILPAASTTAVGAAQIATSAEATAGTNTTKIMTPALAKQELDKKVTQSELETALTELITEFGGTVPQ